MNRRKKFYQKMGKANDGWRDEQAGRGHWLCGLSAASDRQSGIDNSRRDCIFGLIVPHETVECCLLG